MDHQEAAQLMAVEKYLLNELSPEQRDEFEEHFFDCQECAADLTATEAFLQAARQELKATPSADAAAKPANDSAERAPKKSFLDFLWRPAFAVPAFALLLLVVGYQNVVVFPRLAGEVAALRAPQLLATLSLAAGNSRGGETPVVSLEKHQPLLINFDVPAQDRFASYTCVLYAPSGSIAFRIQVSAQQARDTVSITVPAGSIAEGAYTLTVQGNSASQPSPPAIDLAHYRFVVKTQA